MSGGKAELGLNLLCGAPEPRNVLFANPVCEHFLGAFKTQVHLLVQAPVHPYLEVWVDLVTPF